YGGCQKFPVYSLGPVLVQALKAYKPSSHFIQRTKTRAIPLPPAAFVHRQSARITTAGLVNGMIHHGLAGNDRMLGNADVPGDAHLPANLAIRADDGTAGDSRAPGHHGMRADADVMPDLDEVVQFD